ncbi:Glutamate-tRNA ligase [Acididesulfobacillus acetoxydans]|uniref:Glutamate-tRNA ligase n=1 Tax=Acididesulfobacillus acetoxydans TaxID=1561005 RepID=A0A8S0W8H7_9FIRM|nr:tRNA glutamyl-Q(34) synthetase GluQRS [Acididesulfobacillus acetoxydans]CAA7601839.1 Glutamate-tRNA ligase [Acididesulfobacillus acetoxydans]CEJ06854.1 Glutamyl-Q tRNA(Asp) synthetase [Acididesulfobacillus acetoxydans]
MAGTVRGRFAPTPSGEMHLGNAWTAFLAWLQVRRAQGRLVLRIEDLDLERTRPEFYRGIMEDLLWLGLDWDEGPFPGEREVRGSFGPYYQSQREEFYRAALAELQAQGLVYPCFCSRADIRAASRAPHGVEGVWRYPGTCRRLSEAEVQNRISRGEKSSLRFYWQPRRDLTYTDLVYGLKHMDFAAGDFILRRSDGVPAYPLAVVADDIAMQITHIVRGADLLEATFQQVALYEALHRPLPRFVHVPMVYTPDGKRLAKSQGGVSLKSLRARGVRPEAILGLFAFWAGWLPGPEPAAARDLVKLFKLSTLPKAGVVWNPEDL